MIACFLEIQNTDCNKYIRFNHSEPLLFERYKKKQGERLGNAKFQATLQVLLKARDAGGCGMSLLREGIAHLHSLP